jgi:serine phosphatase RsbU (regulator of sigma subunit)
MDNKLNILILEDSESDSDLLVRFLKKQGVDFGYTRVWNKIDFTSALKACSFDIIISDHSLPQFSGMEAFRIVKSENINIPFILVTGTLTEKALIEYSKEGIDDYILKENLLRLPSAIEHVISNKKIEKLKDELESAYLHIKESINYAKTIQDAMLPNPAILSNFFPESFILFKPKDTISGDFYWFKFDTNTFLVAAADCTGHGVPGALLSMIGIEKLNSITLETNEPDEVLNKLNTRITNALRQSSKLANSEDGMDIALCSFNKKTRSLRFAGANRSLWIIGNNKSEVEEIKGTRETIGGAKKVLFTKFEGHEFGINKGDTIYLFSDGFADQFGGEKNKKITRKGFKRLLLSIQNQAMNQQQEILSNFIDDWKLGYKQIDDILVIGIRVDF